MWDGEQLLTQHPHLKQGWGLNSWPAAPSHKNLPPRPDPHSWSPWGGYWCSPRSLSPLSAGRRLWGKWTRQGARAAVDPPVSVHVHVPLKFPPFFPAVRLQLKMRLRRCEHLPLKTSIFVTSAPITMDHTRTLVVFSLCGAWKAEAALSSFFTKGVLTPPTVAVLLLQRQSAAYYSKEWGSALLPQEHGGNARGQWRSRQMKRGTFHRWEAC